MTAFQSGEWADVPSIGLQTPPPLPKKLSVVFPFIPKEIEQVKGFLTRSIELCGQIPRSIFLLPFKGINASEIEALAKEAFAQVGTIRDSEGIMSDWQNGQMIRSASGPNSLFRQAAWFFYLSNGQAGSWLWLEPDCTPIGKRWLLDLEQEYYESLRPFMGVQMIIQDGRRYMNGVGVYPWNAIQYAPLLVQSTMWKQHPNIEVGFDVAGGFDVLKKAHMTRKIQLELKKDKIELKPETVLLHGQNLSGKHDSASSLAAQKETEEPVSPAQPTLSAAPVRSESVDPGGTTDKANPSVGTQKDYGAEEEHDSADDLIQALEEHRAASLKAKRGDSNYGALSEDIRSTIQKLVNLWNGQPHRKVLIVKELRKAKLVPKHFR